MSSKGKTSPTSHKQRGKNGFVWWGNFILRGLWRHKTVFLKRTYVSRLVLCGVLTVLIFVLFNVQIIKGPEYAAEGIAGRSVSYTLNAPRGTIFDSEGNVLASSTTRYDIIADPVNIAQYKHYEKNPNSGWELVGVGPVEAAKQLAPILGMEESLLGGLLAQDPHTEAEWAKDKSQLDAGLIKQSKLASRYRVVAEKVTPAVRRKILDLNVTGISSRVRDERLYPRGATAANLVGFMANDPKDNSKSVGIAGIELTMDKVLKSTPGKGSVEVAGGTGAVIPGGVRNETPAKAGRNVHLTINADLTAFAQQIADQTRDRFQADWVSIAVEEVKTGRLLAIGDSGVTAFDQVKDFSKVQFGSHMVKDAYEPGSTGKVVTMVAALEKGAVNPLTAFSCPSEFTAPNGQVFHDSHNHPVERLTAAGIIAKSSNTGIVQVGDKVKDQDRYNLMRAFGWGERSGIQLPSESPGILASPTKWDGRQRYTTMFGQGVATTPLQVVNMMATIGNNGVRNLPRIVDGYSDADGTYEKAAPAAPKQVLSAKTSKEIIRMMESVVTREGTGLSAAVPGYNVAVKTGTSEINGKGGVIGSVAGLIPAEDPVVAIVAVTYKPKISSWGSVVAAPAFVQVAQRTMEILGVPPSVKPNEGYPINAQ